MTAYFLDNIAEWILELDYGKGVPWKGNYSSWLDQKQERLRHEEKAESQRQKTLERELEWVRMSPHGRQAKSKARIGQYLDFLGAGSGQAHGGTGNLYPSRAAAGRLGDSS